MGDQGLMVQKARAAYNVPAEILHDDEAMFPKAEQTIREGAYLLPEVLAEVVYVLFGVYSVPREELVPRLQILVKPKRRS